MNRFLTRMTLIIVALLQYSVAVFAGPLDDYYLQQFGETGSTQLQKAILSVSPEADEAAHCGMPLKKSLRRDWDLLEQTTQKTLAKQLARPTLASPATYPSIGGHFTVHYATTGTDAPPPADVRGIIGVPDWVEDVAATFENVYPFYVAQGYRPAPTTAGAPYDVYLRELAPQSLYGITTSELSASSAGFLNAVTSWIEIDNDFTENIYIPTTFAPLQSLQITAAHEYHHAVQFGYNRFFDTWYAEATSTWMEDELYNDVNQLYSYIPAWFIARSNLSLNIPQSTTTGGGYGRWIFNRFLAEKHGADMIRAAWNQLAGIPSPGNDADIPMAPVLDTVLSSNYASSLGNDFFGFAKRVYTRDWITHTDDIFRIHVYSPVASYSQYPVNSSVTTPAPPSITLPHYSFAYYKFIPAPSVPSLTISIIKTTGIQTALFKNGGEIAADASSTSTSVSYVASTFGATDELVLLIANTTGTDNHSASFSTDGSTDPVIEPTTPAATSSSGGGCFIATAAYGSYLHPQVQLLRNFRDEYLLTNAPGRAFVALYYHYSPPLADLIDRHPVLRGAARLALTPFVIAVAHPLISAVSLFLFFGALLMPLLRRIKAARSNARPYDIRTT